MKDSVGNEIRRGDIIRMFHFKTTRGVYYMYKQIGEKYKETERLIVYHLPINDFINPEFFLADQKLLRNCVVIQEGAFDIDRKLKRSKKLRG